MNFSDALNLLKEGKKLFRDGWNTKGSYLLVQTPDENSKITVPYIYITIPGVITDKSTEAAPATLIPWFPKYKDLFTDDWSEVVETTATSQA
jgi:hypothetical protein